MEKLKAKKVSNLRKFKTVKERRDYLEKKLHINLDNIGAFSLDEKTASRRNCENMIGITQVPMGVAGPIKINGSEAKGKFVIPLSTTEGALVASINRGCKAISLSGGTNTYACRIGATRGPVFYVGSLEKSKKFRKWIKTNEDKLKKIAEQTSLHLRFKKLEMTGPANYLFVRFYFDTSDAMGMNMATIATQKIVDFIERKTKIKCLSLAGNFDIDKKPAWINFLSKRGFEVWAETTINKKIVKEVLKTTVKNIFDVWLGKCMIGSAMTGSLGFNGHFANIIAALFIATGQDPAHVVEGSIGITIAEIKENKDLYLSVYLPDVMAGTIGGGTGLATQKEALDIIGISGGNSGKNAHKFAEIIGATVLAGELSLLASLAEGSLAKAHIRLGRSKEINKTF